MSSCRLIGFKVEVKQPVKFALFSKMIYTLIKKYITKTITETILKKKGCFVIAFGARAMPSCSSTACDITGLVRSTGQLSNIGISLFSEHTNVISTHQYFGFHHNLDE